MLIRLFQNSLMLMAGQVAQLLIPLIAVPFIALTMSTEEFAITMAALSVIQFGYIISEFGSTIIGSERYHSVGAQSLDSIRDSLLLMRISTACVYFGIALILFPMITANIFVAVISFFALVFFAAQPVWLYSAKEKFLSLTLFTLVGKAVYLILVVILLNASANATTVLFCLMVGNAVTTLALSSFTHGRRNSKTLKISIPETLVVARGGAEILLSRLFLNFHFFLGTPIVLFYGDANQAASYAAAETIVRAMRGILGASTQAGFQYVLRRTSLKHFLIFLAFVFSAGLIAGLCIDLTSELLHSILYGSKFDGFSGYLDLLIIVFVLSSINQALGYPAFALYGKRRGADLTSIVLPVATLLAATLLSHEGKSAAELWIVCILMGELATVVVRSVLLIVLHKRCGVSR